MLSDRLFGRKSEQSNDPESPQLPLLYEAEVLAEQPYADGQDDVETVVLRTVAVSKPRVEVIHECPITH